jgi:hypothetical protein
MPLDTARAMLYLSLARPTERTTRSRTWTMRALLLGK